MVADEFEQFDRAARDDFGFVEAGAVRAPPSSPPRHFRFELRLTGGQRVELVEHRLLVVTMPEHMQTTFVVGEKVETLFQRRRRERGNFGGARERVERTTERAEVHGAWLIAPDDPVGSDARPHEGDRETGGSREVPSPGDRKDDRCLCQQVELGRRYDHHT